MICCHNCGASYRTGEYFGQCRCSTATALDRRLKKPIPRIFSVADTLNAIISGTAYRAAQQLKAARAEIARGSRKQFDPHIVEVFLDMPDKIWEDLTNEFKSKPD